MAVKYYMPLPGLLALASGMMGMTAWAEASRPLPTPFPEARYQQMSVKSPFAVASADSAVAAPTPGFAAHLYVDGVARIGEKDFVAIKSSDPDQQSTFFLEVGGTAPNGMKVDGVKWSDETGKSTVDVSKAGEKATLVFDEQQMAKEASGPQPGQPGGVRLPTIPGQAMQPGQRPPGFPSNFGGPQPGAAFNRNRVFPQMQSYGPQGQPLGPTPGVDVRRRVRVIQSAQ